jgi:hypothetical protein
MQTSLARLYAHIMVFFISALKRYKDSSLVHAIKSILQPWELAFRSQYEAIAAEAEQIRRFADVSLKVEVRDTRLEVIQGTKNWEMVRKEMNELKIENRLLVGLFEKKFGAIEDSMTGKYTQENTIVDIALNFINRNVQGNPS